MKQPIYFDYAAATPMAPEVFEAMKPYFSDRFYNPSANYSLAKAVREELDRARATVAYWLGANSSEIIFTAGGTEANNLALHGIMEQFPQGNIVTTAIEHESVLAAAHNYSCKEAPVNSQGIVDVPKLIALIDDQTVLVSAMYANNEVGTIQPIKQIAQEIEKIKKQRQAAGNNLPLYYHCDAAQAAAYLDLHVSRLGVDLMTINAGKIYGPKQVGALYVGSRVNIKPRVYGGGQERGLRSGTENVAGAIGLAKALDLVQTRRHQEAERLQALQKEFFESLKQELPEAVVNGSQKKRLPNNVHFTIPGADNERVIFQLDELGIMCAAGSACSADSGEASHVLRAMGLSDAAARSSLRFTMGLQTTRQDVQKAVQALAQSVQ